MRRPRWIRSVRPPKAERQAPLGSLRDRLAVLLALVTLACLGSAFLLSKGTQSLMPGPLASAHGGIENCSACHTKSGSGKLSWVHGLVAGDPLADSKACLTCHKMPDTAFNAHGATADVLKQSTERLTKTAARTPAPHSAHAQSIAFPTHDVVARGLYCATCHQEHQGINFKLSKISSEQCRSCHVVKFDSFDGHHPTFGNYPFKQRTRIIYDHAGHFGKHYPELAKKDPAKRIPDTCATCHNSREDKRVMAVAPFEKTCIACHLDQIIGKERATGPKGIAFLNLPGLDLQTLKKKNASIGEWPDASDAELTPFMKVMISRDERGRALIKTVDSLNLQDLTDASDDQIKAVANLVWEVKGLFHALLKGKASDVLGDLNIGGGAKLSAALVADLTASIPRDVVLGAHQQWLPNLAAEMANRRDTSDQKQGGWNSVITKSRSAGERPGSRARQATPRSNPRAIGRDLAPGPAVGRPAGPGGAFGRGGGGAAGPGGAFGRGGGRAAGPSRLRGPALPPAMRAGVKDAGKAPQPEAAAEESEAANAPANDGEQKRWTLPSGTPRAIKARSKDAEKAAQPEEAAEPGTANSDPDGGKEAVSDDEQPPAIKPDLQDAEKTAPTEEAAGEADTAKAKADIVKEAVSANEQPQAKATEQTDDLLFPTEDELRAIKTGIKGAEKAAPPDGAAGETDTAKAKPDGTKADANAPAAAPADSDMAAAEPQARAAPVISIESDVDPESWAEYGGWYRQDHAIFYRPTGHKDKFIYAWLFLTGPQAPKDDTSPAAAVFDFLTSKDAQGSCTKCHSVDDIRGKGRIVNFSQTSIESKQGRFTKFIHEPHFGILETRGCLTCHALEKGRPYLKSYEQGDPRTFVSTFGAVKKDLCQTCHTRSIARQDCLLCHNYHVNGVVTPIISTKIPAQ